MCLCPKNNTSKFQMSISQKDLRRHNFEISEVDQCIPFSKHKITSFLEYLYKKITTMRCTCVSIWRFYNFFPSFGVPNGNVTKILAFQPFCVEK